MSNHFMDPLSSDLPNVTPASSGKSRLHSAEPDDTPNGSSIPSPSESISISQVEQTIKQLQEALSQISNTRADRIKKIQQALKEGTYSVSSEALADKLIQELSMPPHDSSLS